MTSNDTACIGARLKEERVRLGKNQEDFAAFAQTTKRSQYEYERGGASPGATYLASIAAAGADVQYIVTGVRSAGALAAAELRLLERYRQSPPVLQDAALRVLGIWHEHERQAT